MDLNELLRKRSFTIVRKVRNIVKDPKIFIEPLAMSLMRTHSL